MEAITFATIAGNPSLLSASAAVLISSLTMPIVAMTATYANAATMIYSDDYETPY
jgi:hypothetical protein